MTFQYYRGNGTDAMAVLDSSLRFAIDLPTAVRERVRVKPGDTCRAVMATYIAKYKRRPIIIIEIESIEPLEVTERWLAVILQLGYEE